MIFEISPLLYPKIFFIFLCACVIGQTFVLFSNGTRIKDEKQYSSIFKALLIVAAVTLFIGFRPIHWIFVDTVNYAGSYERVITGEATKLEDPEPVWTFIMNWFANNGFEVNYWFAFICFLSISFVVCYCKNLMPNHLILLLFCCMTGFSFFAGLVNGIRNNLAICIFIYGFSIYFAKRDFKSLIISLLVAVPAYLVHNSVIILLVAFVGSVFIVKTTRFALIIWFGAILVTLIWGPSLSETITILSEDERAMRYLDQGLEGSMGDDNISRFRFDFLLYSSIPVMLGWYITIKRKIHDSKYQLILNTYIISNAIWIVFMYVAFTNRFASLSWSLFGVAMCYPLVKIPIWENKQTRNVALLLWGQLAFYAYMMFK